MKKITNIKAIFEYRVNGWAVITTDTDGTEQKFTQSDDDPSLCNILSRISNEWHEYDDVDEDDFEDFDEEQLLLEPDDIEIAILAHFDLNDDDVEISFELSDDC